MGIAFHPDFAREPYVYAMHTYGGRRRRTMNRLVRMKWDGTHSVTRLSFSTDSLAAGFTMGRASRWVRTRCSTSRPATRGRAAMRRIAASLGGKIFRLTPEGRAALRTIRSATSVWSYGHRNPQGLVFHPTTGVLYSTEHGPNDNDEVNIIREAGTTAGRTCMARATTTSARTRVL